MLKYIINIIFMTLFWTSPAQKIMDSLPVKMDSSGYKQPIKIRFGFDLGKYLWSKYQNSELIDFKIDANFYKDYYVMFNIGNDKHLTDNNLLNYNTIGNYYKIGIGYNIYRNWLDMNNDILVSLNFGHANFDYILNHYTINQPGAIFPPPTISPNQSFKNNRASWLSLASEIEVETFKHLFLGYSINVKYLIYSSDIQGFEISYIPGFNMKNSYSRFGFGMQYFISYQIKF